MSWDCWGSKKPLTPDHRARCWQWLPALAAAAAVLGSGVLLAVKGLLLGVIAALWAWEARRHDPVVALWLWPKAILVETRSGQRRRYPAPFAARHWPGCVRVGQHLLFRHSMDEALWRQLHAVLHLQRGAARRWFRARDQAPGSNP